MSLVLNMVIIITAFLVLYWFFYGQRKYHEMLNPKRKIELKAILFDMDGVIIDSFDAWFSVFNRVRREHKLKEIEIEEFKKRIWGNHFKSEAKVYFKNIDLNIIIDKYNKLFHKYSKKSKLMPDAKKVLSEIKDKKLKIGLVTNSIRKIAYSVLNQYKVKNYFDAIVTGEDVERGKPYPDLVLKACENLKVKPDETLYVGDTKFDFKAAKAAGCYFVGFNTHGDLVISRLSDLLELL